MIAIDLGSNTLRIIEFDGRVWGKSFEKIVRTAEGIHHNGTIGDDAIRRIVDAINEAKRQIDFTQPIRAYTTAAMRLASNASERIEQIEQLSGVKFQIIDGEKEAILTLEAVRYRIQALEEGVESFILADIGGGSTELTRYDQGSIETLSLDFGIVTLSEGAENTLNARIETFKERVAASLPQTSLPLVLTAGTPTTIAAYLLGMDYETYDPHQINGYRLRLGDCYRVYKELLSMNERERRRFVGVGRENLIIAGILMVTSIYEALGTDEAIIIDDGLREGIALEYYKMS